MALAALKTSIITRFANFLRSAQGNTTIIATIAAIPMIGSVGLAVDYMRGVRASEALQHVADAAALAAASAKNVTGTQSEQMNQRATIAANYLNDSVGNVSDIEVIGAPTVATGPNSIKITVDAKVKGSFINVLNALKDGSADLGGGSLGNQAGENSKDINLHVSSTVGFSEDAYLCLLAMNPTQTEAIYFQGNSKFMATCSVHANSNATTAIRTWGNAAAYAASFTTRGGWAGSGFSPDPMGYAPFVKDPVADPSSSHYLPMPTVGATCTATNKQVKNTTTTLVPGVYCGGIDISTHGVANLQKGIYIIKNGDLKIDSQSELHAPNGTLIYLTGDNSNIDITSGAVVELVGPNKTNSSSGDSTYPYRGWALMQDRDSGIGNTNTIYSKGGVNIKGGAYMPAQHLVVWANGNMNENSGYFPMIVDTLNMNGTATLFVNLDWEDENLGEPIYLKQAGRVFVSQ
ncbi:MAG TPA: pilus assembly protein TadG-related protein [Aestuariivirga sp.]|nr:pilus assembly protein TadG-related protein [Aestuariivirga sp.]